MVRRPVLMSAADNSGRQQFGDLVRAASGWAVRARLEDGLWLPNVDDIDIFQAVRDRVGELAFWGQPR